GMGFRGGSAIGLWSNVAAGVPPFNHPEAVQAGHPPESSAVADRCNAALAMLMRHGRQGGSARFPIALRARREQEPLEEIVDRKDARPEREDDDARQQEEERRRGDEGVAVVEDVLHL